MEIDRHINYIVKRHDSHDPMPQVDSVIYRLYYIRIMGCQNTVQYKK